MPEIKITFSNGYTVVFHEEQAFQTRIKSNNKLINGEVFTLWSNENSLMVPSFLKILENSDFFYDIEKPEILYNSTKVVNCEEI